MDKKLVDLELTCHFFYSLTAFFSKEVALFSQIMRFALQASFSLAS